MAAEILLRADVAEYHPESYLEQRTGRTAETIFEWSTKVGTERLMREKNSIVNYWLAQGDSKILKFRNIALFFGFDTDF